LIRHTLAKIPADVAWTFQTLDKRGMVLNAAQTWHQLRPGELLNNCGGCHAHKQQPTDFKLTAAAKPNDDVFDLTSKTSLLTTKAKDESKKKWDANNETGVRYQDSTKTEEYFRDVKPIFVRSCVVCHSGKSDKTSPGWLLGPRLSFQADIAGRLGIETHEAIGHVAKGHAEREREGQAREHHPR